MSEETGELIRSLRETIRAQATEMEALQAQLGNMNTEREQEVGRRWIRGGRLTDRNSARGSRHSWRRHARSGRKRYVRCACAELD